MPDEERETARAKVKRLNAQRRQLADRIVMLSNELNEANDEYNRVAYRMDSLRVEAGLPEGVMRPWTVRVDTSAEPKVGLTKKFSQHEERVQERLGKELEAEPRD